MTETHADRQRQILQPVSRDVRAGPGDAGATDRPEELPKTARDRRSDRVAGPFTIATVLVGALVVLLLWALF